MEQISHIKFGRFCYKLCPSICEKPWTAFTHEFVQEQLLVLFYLRIIFNEPGLDIRTSNFFDNHKVSPEDNLPVQ